MMLMNYDYDSKLNAEDIKAAYSYVIRANGVINLILDTVSRVYWLNRKVQDEISKRNLALEDKRKYNELKKEVIFPLDPNDKNKDLKSNMHQYIEKGIDQAAKECDENIVKLKKEMRDCVITLRDIVLEQMRHTVDTELASVTESKLKIALSAMDSNLDPIYDMPISKFNIRSVTSDYKFEFIALDPETVFSFIKEDDKEFFDSKKYLEEKVFHYIMFAKTLLTLI